MVEHQIGGWPRRERRGGTLGGWMMAAWIGTSCLALTVLPSCGGGEEEPKYPPQQQMAQPQQTAQPAAAPATAAPAPTATAAPAPVGPQPLSPADEMALKAAVEARAAAEAKGMKPEGQFFGGVAQTGGTVESPQVMIDLGKCYSVIAQGGMGVTELDIQLQAVSLLPFIQSPTVAVDQTTGAMAAISPCWKNGFPAGFPGKVVLKVTAGSGPVGGMLYVK